MVHFEIIRLVSRGRQIQFDWILFEHKHKTVPTINIQLHYRTIEKLHPAPATSRGDFTEPPALELELHPASPILSGRFSSIQRNMYNNGVLVEPINTDEMKLALRTNQTPFALLRPLNGIPVFVRVLPAGDKQMLVPLTVEDLRRHGEIILTATPKMNMPIVAIITESYSTDDGSLHMSVQSPELNVKYMIDW